MPPRLRAVVVCIAVALGPLLAGGCSADDAPRPHGDPVTAAEAQVLAGLLQRNFKAGGAEFVATAPYGEDTVLTLTGEVDFRGSVGRAQAVTAFGNGRPDDVRTVFFTRRDLWVGELPGLAEALGERAPGVGWLRRPLSAAGEPLLLDAVVHVLLRLTATTADGAQEFQGAGYTWQGQRSIDSRLTSLFELRQERTVAVAEDSEVLVQYATALADVDLTVTLSDHGRRSVTLPPAEETAPAADHPEVAAALGV